MDNNNKVRKPGVVSIALGAVMVIYILGSVLSIYTTGTFYAGGFLLLIPVVGFLFGINSLRVDSIDKIFGTIGIGLNVIGFLGSLAFFILRLVVRFI